MTDYRIISRITEGSLKNAKFFCIALVTNSIAVNFGKKSQEIFFPRILIWGIPEIYFTGNRFPGMKFRIREIDFLGNKFREFPIPEPFFRETDFVTRDFFIPKLTALCC